MTRKTRLVFALLAALLGPAAARAEVPVGLLAESCDDDDADGYIDDFASCWADFVRCDDSNGNRVACLDRKECSWRDDTSTCEGSYWDFISYIPQRWRARMADPGELNLGSGMHADKAWQVHTGRWDTVIAVMDSGIRWHEADLQNKHYLNRGELPEPLTTGGAPCGRDQDENAACPDPDPYDCNADCVFNVEDYLDDPAVDPLASNDATFYGCYYPFNNTSALPLTNTFLEPSDIICAFSDGIDGDGDGYVDNISGWDAFWDDNNPYDDTDFGHGTGEAKDSAAEANNDSGLPGGCPNCAVMSVRVGDSFVVDSNNWAAGVVFAIDTGADVLQSAVGSITNTSFSQAAIEYAWERGIIDIVSAADETSQHQNYPGAIRHAEYVHAVRYDTENISQATTFLNFSNCTNFGGRLVLSAPSTGCSSGATGASSGVGGLIASVAQDMVDGGGLPLSGPEIHQIYVQSVDDIDQPNSLPGATDYDPAKYPSREGWDMYFGYGRLNARKAIDIILEDRIPPEVDLLEPLWWALIDPNEGSLDITGHVGAPRSAGGIDSWVLEYAVGVEPDDSAPVNTTVWIELASGTDEATGVLATFDPTAIPNFDPSARVDPFNTRASRGPVDDNVTKALKVNRYTITLRLRAVDAEGRQAEDRRTVYVHHDPTWKPGFPVDLGVSGESSPKLWDLDGDGAMEIILGDADGRVHAFTSDATELAGWPVQTNPGRVIKHAESWAFTHGANGIAGDGDELPASVASAIVATPAIGDITGSGDVAVVAATLDGEVYAWSAAGTLLAGFPVVVPGDTASSDTNDDVYYEIGIFAAPALGDLDGDGDLEIVIAAMDHQVFALHGDGSLVSGFPVSGPPDPDDPTKPYLRLIFDATIDADGQGRRIVSSPAIGDLDGDGNLEIVVGTNEAIDEQFSLVYAFSYDRGAGRPVAYGKRCGTQPTGEDCWPIIMVGGYPNALPYVGEGAPGSPILADLDGDGTLEVAAASIADFGRIYRHTGYNSAAVGSAFLELKSGGGFYGPQSNSDQSSSLVMINSGAFGDVDGDSVLDYFIGAAGANFVDNLLEDGKRADFDHQLAGWNSADGTMLRGFPQVVEDLQFFLNPLIADVTGDGKPEVINTSATFTIHAFDANGVEPAGWPKFTGQWQIASPAVGDVDGDGLLEMAAVTRAGLLFVYETEGSATGNVQWPSFRHDARNSGNYSTPDPKLAFPLLQLPGRDDDGCGCTSSAPGLLAALAGIIMVRRRRRS